MELMETKVCVSCKKEKKLTDFYKQTSNKVNKYGKSIKYVRYQSMCKQCRGVVGSYSFDTSILDTMIEIYQERGLKHITEAFKVIGKAELKRLAHERLNK